MKKYMYAVYDTHFFEQCVGVFDSINDVANYFGVKQSTVCSEMSRNQKLKHRYIVSRIEKEKSEE